MTIKLIKTLTNLNSNPNPNLNLNPNQNPTKKKMNRHHSSPFPACFRLPTTRTIQPSDAPPHLPPPPPPPPHTPPPNLTTSLYQTQIGLFSLTWSRSLLARTLHLHLHPDPDPSPSSSFHLTLLPFLFFSNHGVKLLPFSHADESLHILWDFTRAKFGSGPEPESGYYIGIVSSSTVLLVGDMDKAFHSRVKSYFKSKLPGPGLGLGSGLDSGQAMVVRREHVCGTQFYTTKTTVGGRTRVILIEVSNKTIDDDDPRLVIRVDNKRVIQVKHLKWKFRGSERFDIDGHRVHLSWDVYNWLFDGGGATAATAADEGYALFTFRFEKEFDCDHDHDHKNRFEIEKIEKRVLMWSQDSCGLSYERKKMKKKLLVKTSSSSSSSLSSASSSGSSSVMEWESVEENELKAPTGFSLLVYAWKN